MAGFVKGVKYDWKIEINQDEMYAVLKCTAEKAYRVFNELNKMCPGSKLYCNGKLVGK